jgi:hypothetical protein
MRIGSKGGGTPPLALSTGSRRRRPSLRPSREAPGGDGPEPPLHRLACSGRWCP